MKNETRSITCCFTGHRSLLASSEAIISRTLEPVLIGLICSGIRCFYTGGERGFDIAAARTVLRLRESYPDIRLILVLSSPFQSPGWLEADIIGFGEMKAGADEIIYIAEYETPEAVRKRSRYLVDHSSVCVCYQTRIHGGTADTVKYASTQGLKIMNLFKY